MQSATKITAAVVLLAAVANANMAGRHSQEKFLNRLAENGNSVSHMAAHTQAEEAAATFRLQALLEKAKANTEHSMEDDKARFKALDAKLRLDIGHLNRDITEHEGELALTKKQELIASNHIHELTARLARLANRHNKLVREQAVVATERKALTKAHDDEIAHLTHERDIVLSTKVKLDKMQKYLEAEGKVTFAELEEVMTEHARAKAGDIHVHVHEASHFENKVTRVTDAQREKNTEIASMLGEFVGMLDKELAQAEAAINRSNDHFKKASTLLDLKDGHLNNELRDVELDEKTSSEHLSSEKVQLMDLQHKHQLLDQTLASENKHHAELEQEDKQEAVAEDRKQHNFLHERDVETTLIGMLGGSDQVVSSEFKSIATQEADEKRAALAKEHEENLKAQRDAFAVKEEARLAREKKQQEDRAEAAKVRAAARAAAEAQREEAAKAREDARKKAEEERRAAVRAERAAAQKARKDADAARAAKEVADEKAAADRRAAAQAAKVAREEAWKAEDDKKRGDDLAAKEAAHQAANAKATEEEKERKLAADNALAAKRKEAEDEQKEILDKHNEAVSKAQAAAADAAKKRAEAQAAAFQTKQKEIADEAQAKKDALKARVDAAEKKAAEDAENAKKQAEKIAGEKAAAAAERKKERAAKRAAAIEARKAELAKRKAEKEEYHTQRKAVYQH